MQTLIAAVSLGLFAGLSPGPLMAVVIASSLEGGFRAGALTAVAPLLTDLPVILLSLLVLGRLPESFLAAVTLVGGLFVGWVGVKTVLEAGHSAEVSAAPGSARRYVWRGTLVNLLGPHPWIFWFTVGTPLMLERWSVAAWEAIAFPAVFLGLLVGSKLGVAWATARGRRFVTSRWYGRLVASLGSLLIVFALWLVWRGLGGLRG